MQNIKKGKLPSPTGPTPPPSPFRFASSLDRVLSPFAAPSSSYLLSSFPPKLSVAVHREVFMRHNMLNRKQNHNNPLISDTLIVRPAAAPIFPRVRSSLDLCI